MTLQYIKKTMANFKIWQNKNLAVIWGSVPETGTS